LGEAVWGQLLSGHLHQQAGLLNTAQESYWKVVSRYPEHPLAASALYQVAEMHRICGEPDDAATVYRLAVDAAPDSALAVLACEEISRLCTAHEAYSSEQARQHLQEVAIAHPERKAGDWARYFIGRLCLMEGDLEGADRTWALLVGERPTSEISGELAGELAELRYSVGTGAFLEGDYNAAADWLVRLLANLEWLRLPEQRRNAVFRLGEAYQKLKQWERAAEAFSIVAVPGSPSEEVALFELGRSQMSAGNHAEALEALTRLLDRFPDSTFADEAEECIRRVAAAP